MLLTQPSTCLLLKFDVCVYVRLLLIGRAQKNAKHGADDKAKTLMEAMHEKMTLRESTRPHIFKTIR